MRLNLGGLLADIRRHISTLARGPAPARASSSGSAGRRTLRQAWGLSLAGIVVVLVLTTFINVLKLTVPLYIFHVLDRVVASRNIDTLILLTVITVLAILAAAVAEVVRRWMLAHWGAWIEQHFGRQLFVGSLDRRRARGPARALEDLSEVRQFVGGSGAASWLDAMYAPFFLLLVYIIHPVLAGIVLAGMIAMLILGIANEVVTRPMRAASRKARLRSERWVATAEQHAETVSGLSMAESLASRWHHSLRRQMSESLATRLAGLSMGEAMRLVEALQRVACYGVGVWLTISDSLSVGGIIAAAVVGRFGTSAVRRAMGSWRQLVLVVRAYHRIERRLDTARAPELAVRDPDALLSLHIDQITHTHNAWSRPLFAQLDLELAPGQMLCIKGPSGSGKTTLARLIAGIATPTMGTVRLGGLDIARFTRGERQSLLGYLPQDAAVFNGTIAENISSLTAGDARQIVEAARLAGIHEVITRLPEGYETRLADHANPLAGGEIRRIGLARALFGRPRLIVLDEPEANLDEALVDGLVHALAQCRAWGSVVVVTSQTDRLAELADKVVALDHGGIPKVQDRGVPGAASVAHSTARTTESPSELTPPGPVRTETLQ